MIFQINILKQKENTPTKRSPDINNNTNIPNNISNNNNNYYMQNPFQILDNGLNEDQNIQEESKYPFNDTGNYSNNKKQKNENFTDLILLNNNKDTNNDFIEYNTSTLTTVEIDNSQKFQDSLDDIFNKSNNFSSLTSDV